MKANELEGWGTTDTPLDGYSSEGELNISKLVAGQNRKKIKSGGFQMMGLSHPVLKGILRKGYKIPTPIQRRTIPLILEGKDVVAMARTGSGKTAAFLVPLFEKLKIHSAKVGARALILSPTRELALQTLAFAKELGKFTGLRAASILGGESIENQFAALHDNPDIIIATPGRFTHVCVEMNLKLDTLEYVVFDEADRLFEMGFKEQLGDIISRLSPLRQMLLFSATLPKMLVEFARAGLSDPTLIRLDVDTKISENLKVGFFKVNSEDKIHLLIHLLKNVVDSSEFTVVFAPTKHHVEYIHQVLSRVGLSSTYIFSSLDPSARKINIAKFRMKKVGILIVTDVAARGIDIPLLDNVINFNFPPKTKLFVHRVGRVARAGRSGTAYSFVSPDEVCYLLELHMFLSRSIRFCSMPEETTGACYPRVHSEEEEEDWDRMFGRVPQEIIDDTADCVRKMLEQSYDLRTLKISAINALQKYIKTRPPPCPESNRRLKTELWGKEVGFHPVFKVVQEPPIEKERIQLLEKLKNVRPKTTIFEIKKAPKESNPGTLFMHHKRRVDGEKIENFHNKMKRRKEKILEKNQQQLQAQKERDGVEETSEVELLTTFNTVIGKRKKDKNEFGGVNSEPVGERFSQPTGQSLLAQEEAPRNHFIPYAPPDHYAEQGYSVMSNFERESASATLDLIGDDENMMKQNRPQMKWDRKQKKFKGQEQEKKIKTESGAWVSASYKKDLYYKWKLKMQPHQDEEEEEEDGRESKDWRSKGKKNKDKKGTGFISLMESTSKLKSHPLVKGRKTERFVQQKKGPRQVKTYEQRMKSVAQKARKMRFQKDMEKLRQKRKAMNKSSHQKKQRKK